MKVYIAGPMTGRPDHNWPSFFEAKAHWLCLGHQVVTPPDINNIVYQHHFGRDFDPSTDPFDYGDPISNEMYGRDCLALSTSDAIVLLPGWSGSKGARHEVATARLLKLRIFDHTTGEELQLDDILEAIR